MKSLEHRTVGEAAAGGALVELGDGGAERFVLSYGDVVALSGDYFASHDLFRLAAIPGERGTKLATRDEIICALKVMAVDGAFVDARFEPGGEFSDFRFTATAGTTEIERRSGTASWPWPLRTATISSLRPIRHRSRSQGFAARLLRLGRGRLSPSS
jgi:hypothetical protein